LNSHLTEEFVKLFQQLPERIQRKARKNYHLWRDDPHHPSLDFKKVHPRRPIYSVRVGTGWRAVGLMEGNSIVWFWIGSHNAYDKLLNQLS
jgi:hypothetical protein